MSRLERMIFRLNIACRIMSEPCDRMSKLRKMFAQPLPASTDPRGHLTLILVWVFGAETLYLKNVLLLLLVLFVVCFVLVLFLFVFGFFLQLKEILS